jgi:hypothetical protein
MSNEQRLRDYYDQSNPVVLPTLIDAKVGTGIGGLVGAAEIGRRLSNNREYFDPILRAGEGGLRATSKKLLKPLAVGSYIGTGLGAAYGLKTHLMPEIKKYQENKDLPGVAAATAANVDTDLPTGAASAAGFYAGFKGRNYLPKAIAAKHPIISLMAPIVAGSIAGGYAGKKLGEKYNQVAIDKISDHYYGQNKQAETHTSNKYLVKIAAAVDKSNPVYQKMTAAVDARRAEKEAAKDAELTPAQKKIQELMNKERTPTPAKPTGAEASHAKMQGLIQGRKDAAHAEFESGNKYLDRAERISATHTPPNAAGTVERLPSAEPVASPLRPGQELTVHAPVNARAVPGETVDGGVEAASRLGQKLRGLIPKTTLGRVAAGAIGAAGLAGAGYGASHRGQQA